MPLRALKLSFALPFALALFALPGCQKEGPEATEGAEAPNPTAQQGPTLAPTQRALALNAQGEPIRPTTGQALPPSHPPIQAASAPAADPYGSQGDPYANRGAAAPAAPPPAAQLAAAPIAGEQGSPISGTLRLADGMAEKVPAGAVLFLILRQDAGEGVQGPLLASQKLPAEPGVFPLQYRIGAQDLMFPGSTLSGSVRLSVRIDADGDAMSKQPGDLTGEHPKAVTVGAQQVDIVIDTVL